MANAKLFQSNRNRVPEVDTINEAGGVAYSLSDKHALAQYASTGMLSKTFYASAESQLNDVLRFCQNVEPEFIAKTAIYARQEGYMKDMPALLCAVLANKDVALLERIFPSVIDNGRMLRNFVQIIRSGVTGRKSLGYAPRRMVRNWLESRHDHSLFNATVGNNPSIVDIIKMVHPRPSTEKRNAMYGYLLGKEYNAEALPQIIKDFERYKMYREAEVPNVDFRMLTSLQLGTKEWKQIALNAKWQWTRMNINTMNRHGVFEDRVMVQLISDRLRDREQIMAARQFPYQMLTAYLETSNHTFNTIPRSVLGALQDALDISVDNVPTFDANRVVVCPDISGSMNGSVSQKPDGTPSATSCAHVAGLVASAVLRKNPDSIILPFHYNVVKMNFNDRDSVMTNADKIARGGGGGTNCSAPLSLMNEKNVKADLVIYISDYESWMDSRGNSAGYSRGTGMMTQWKAFKRSNPRAKLVCIDIVPQKTIQAPDSGDILNIGGFSDNVWSVINDFVGGRLNADHWVGVIEKIQLP